MPRPTPLHERTRARCRSWSYKDWSGFIAPCSYYPHSEREYFALRHAVGVLDVSPLYKVDVRGPDAARALERVCTRHIGGLRVGRVAYTALCNARGQLMDEGNVARLAPEHFRLSSSEPWVAWIERHARGLRVELEDTREALAALAVQGPLARAALQPVVDFDLDRMRYFRVRRVELAGRTGWISRTGYTGDLGFELWCPAEDAPALWDALMRAGAGCGIDPVGLDALDVARIEAGYLLQGVDYISARHAQIPAHCSTPSEAGLGWTVALDKGPFVGRSALVAEQERGPRWALVGVELDWPALEALYERYKLPPHLAPCASRQAVPLYTPGSRRKQIGQLTSSTWSPTLKRYIGLAQLRVEHAAAGSELLVEHTVDYARELLPARTVARPFFDPPRKSSVPSREQP